MIKRKIGKHNFVDSPTNQTSLTLIPVDGITSYGTTISLTYPLRPEECFTSGLTSDEFYDYEQRQISDPYDY